MENSKLVNILRKFDQSQIDRLKTFLQSPYFVIRQTLMQFGLLILNEYPDFKGITISGKYIYQEIFPDKIYQDQTINDLMTQTIGLIHKFLSIENFQKDSMDENLRLLQELRVKNLNKEFLRMGSKFSNQLEKSKTDQEYYYHKMKYESELDNFYINNKENRGDSRYLQNKSNAFDNFYLISKLKLACEIINRENIFAAKFEIAFLEEVTNYVKARLDQFADVPALVIYYRITLTLIKPEETQNFYELKALLEKSFDEFSKEELQDMYGFAQNYCIKKINSGKIEYTRELFALYDILLNTELIFENNYLSQWHYKNIVTIGLRMGNFDWIANFIEKFRDKIHPDYKEMAYFHNMAYLFYERKDYSNALKMNRNYNEALKKLTDPGFDDTFYNIDSRTLLLKIYFEQNDGEPLRGILDSLTLFLKRNKKVSENQKNNYLNLIKFTRKLYDIKRKFRLDPEKQMPLLAELKNTVDFEKNIVNPKWLLARIEYLEKELY